MIPVTPAAPPPDFEKMIVTPARKWAQQRGWSWNAPPPTGHAGELPPYWRRCLNDLHEAYGGVCAYLAVHMHRALQSSSVDHFHPKSLAPIQDTYAWGNYRLASHPMNTNKGESQDIMDPFDVPQGLFELDLFSGCVLINQHLAKPATAVYRQARATIARLKLNDGSLCSLRLEYVTDYLNACLDAVPEARAQARTTLAVQSPFVYWEVVRQGL